MSKESTKPLLQNQEEESNSDPAIGVPVPENSNIIWEGTTWQACPGIFMCFAPLLCSEWQWKISKRRIDLIHGWCSSDEETVDLRRVVDLHFHRNFFQMILGRGTITIHSASDEFPELKLTTFGTKEIYRDLREAWSQARIGTAVDHHTDHDI